MDGVSKKYLATAAPIEKREKYIAIRNKIVKAIYDAGGRLMAGSDTPEWLMLYGYTLHLEMISAGCRIIELSAIRNESVARQNRGTISTRPG